MQMIMYFTGVLTASVIWIVIIMLLMSYKNRQVNYFRGLWVDFHGRWLDECKEHLELDRTLSQLRDNTPDCGACAEGFWCGSISVPHTCGKPNPKVEIKEITSYAKYKLEDYPKIYGFPDRVWSRCCHAPIEKTGTDFEEACCDVGSGYNYTKAKCLKCGKSLHSGVGDIQVIDLNEIKSKLCE